STGRPGTGPSQAGAAGDPGSGAAGHSGTTEWGTPGHSGAAARGGRPARAGRPRPATLGGHSAGDEADDASEMPPFAPLPEQAPVGRGRTPRVIADTHSRIPGRLRTLEPEPEAGAEGDGLGESESAPARGGAGGGRPAREPSADRPAGGGSVGGTGAPRG